MKRISIAIFSIIFTVSQLSAANAPEDYLYQADKSVELFLLTINDNSKSILRTYIFNQLSAISQKILTQVNKNLPQQQQLSVLPLTQNIDLLVRLAGESSAYYQQANAADKLSLTLHTDPDLLLLHIYTYALIHYKDPIKQLYFYRMIADANSFLAQALMDNSQVFVNAVWMSLQYLVKIPTKDYDHLAHAHGLYHK